MIPGDQTDEDGHLKEKIDQYGHAGVFRDRCQEYRWTHSTGDTADLHFDVFIW